MSKFADSFDRFMMKHQRVADFFLYFDDEVVDPDNDPAETKEFWQDAKNAPAVAAAKASETNQKIIYLSLARQQPTRKVVR